MDTSKKSNFNLYLLVFCFVIILGLNLFLFIKGFYKETLVSIMYKENNSIHYQVYLRDNDYFETEYLEEGKTYITSLIDYIKINYKYNINFDHPVSGDYKYYVVASVEANKPNNEVGNYWTKNYRITDEKVNSLNKNTEFTIDEVVDVDYNKYNIILNDFKKTLSLTSDGLLKVYLVVEGDFNSNGVKIPLTSNLLLQMPLSEKTIEASIDLEAKNNANEVSQVVDSPLQKVLKSLCIIISVLLEIGIVLVIISIKKKQKESNMYESTLQKILTTYDSIIVNIEEFPNLTEHNIINVSSFEELLDAHSEVRMPINFYRGYNKCHFVLINDNTVWKYTIKKNDFN